jgi:hypothetical protein
MTRVVVVLAGFLVAGRLFAGDAKVDADWSQVPELKEWCEEAAAEIRAWHPRISNLLASEGFVVPAEIQFKINKSEKGVGGTAGTRIGVSSGWVKKHPEDMGMVIHELTHVIQNYKGAQPGWVTEGIADYIRWAIYEGKPQAWFPRSKKPDGYKGGYRDAAGFFLWLEAGDAPGIVRQLNRAMRAKSYEEGVFKARTGKSLQELWKEYQEG